MPFLRTRAPANASTADAADNPGAVRGRLPLVGGTTWLDVVAAAHDRCECEGWCGRTHGSDHGWSRQDGDRLRCRVRDAAGAPLHVLAIVPDTGEDGLAAVCRRCHDRWANQPLDDTGDEPGDGLGERAAYSANAVPRGR